jgi:hypothetical protein
MKTTGCQFEIDTNKTIIIKISCLSYFYTSVHYIYKFVLK